MRLGEHIKGTPHPGAGGQQRKTGVFLPEGDLKGRDEMGKEVPVAYNLVGLELKGKGKELPAIQGLTLGAFVL